MNKILGVVTLALVSTGCTVVSVAGTVVSTTASVAGTVIETTASVAGSVVKGVAHTVTGSEDE
jgi:hypothetical protein